MRSSSELLRIKRSLTAAGYEDLDESTQRKLELISRPCEPCQYEATAPKHFKYFCDIVKFTISQKYLGGRFNHTLEVDLATMRDDGARGSTTHPLLLYCTTPTVEQSLEIYFNNYSK